MGRVVALVALVLLLLGTAAGNDPSTPLDVALSVEGQTPDPVSPARLEASGESDVTTLGQRLGKGLTSVTFEGSEQSPPADSAPRESLGSDSSSLDSSSFGPDALPRAGPVLDVPVQSSESEEGAEQDVDSEEALGSQGI